MKAYLIYWSPATRVVVPDDATEEQILDLAKQQIKKILYSDFSENVELIIEDQESPYDSKFDNQ